jgi:Kef-type K+ transport system membrane component KefB
MTDTELAALFFLQAGFILLVCRAVGWLAARAGQPQVVAEMVAGFLIGPSFFGWIAPDAQATLFPQDTRKILFVVSQIGLVLYMFCVGLEFRSDHMIKHGRRAAAVSFAGIAAPFVLGGSLGLMLLEYGGFFTEKVRSAHAVLFVGAAMSITAFPMLARIIYERGIAGTALGTLALAAGALDDAAAWIILAVVVGSFSGSAMLGVIAAAGGLLYVMIVFGGARPLFRRLNTAAEGHGGAAPWMLATTLAALALGAWFTDLVGIYSVFGAFMLGAAIPRGVLTRDLQHRIEPLTTALLLPFFFVYSGLNTRLALVNTVWLWTVAGAVFVAACAGKGVACWLAARATGASRRDALGVATLMNARGLMELILLNIGLQRGLITPTLFTILVLMAIGTTLMTGPLFSYVYGRDPVEATDPRLAVGKTT